MDPRKIIEEIGYVAVGFTVLGIQQAHVQRRQARGRMLGHVKSLGEGFGNAAAQWFQTRAYESLPGAVVNGFERLERAALAASVLRRQG
ncbi:MAG: hypothetical protein ACRDV9_00985 [Acidimicrobiia bacterium]